MWRARENSSVSKEVRAGLAKEGTTALHLQAVSYTKDPRNDPAFRAQVTSLKKKKKKTHQETWACILI